MVGFRLSLVVACCVLVVAATGVRADEPQGCTAFKWPLEAEAAKLRAPGQAVPDGAAAKSDGSVYDLDLVPLDEAHLPHPPERKPKTEGSRAGFIRFGVPATPGFFQVAASQGAWIDVVQDGRYVKPVAFTGSADCPGLRKSLRFNLGPAPFVVEVSSTAAHSVALLVEPVRR